MGVGAIISVAVMSSRVVFVNVLEVRWECEKGLACVRGAMRAAIATCIVISTFIRVPWSQELTVIEAILNICGDIVKMKCVLRQRRTNDVAVDDQCQ